MNVLIVDDERPAREELQWLLEQCEDVSVLGEAASAEDAQRMVEEFGDELDLVFLDINMPGIGGIRLAELFDERESGPDVIFVTAYDHHALDAFNVGASDYLLKPVRLARLQKAIERMRQSAAAADSEAEAIEPARRLNRISVNVRGSYEVIPIDDVLFFESEDGIVVVQTADSRHITDFNLKFLEKNLDPEHFFRCHRSYIVRLDSIESISPWGAGTYRLILNRNTDMGVPLARSRATDLKALIPWNIAGA